MRLPVLVTATLGSCLAACTGDRLCPPRVVTSNVGCRIDQDCADEGFNALSCLNGVCQRPCLRDVDCAIPAFDEEDPPACREGVSSVPAAFCEGQVCRLGCPDVPCAPGEVCQAARCALDYRGFERGSQPFVNLSTLGWNAIDRPAENTRMAIVYRGDEGCRLGDPDCAGVASEGERFALLARQPTPPKGTSVTAFTCRPCRCCLECLATPFDETDPPPPIRPASCPVGRTAPAPIACFDPPPAHCRDVCQACDACPDADPARIGERLASCEVAAARKTCPSCRDCDALLPACTRSACPMCATAPASLACGECVRDRCQSRPECRSCGVCEDALDCDPNDAACMQQGGQCAGLGVGGCFFTPVSYRDEQLDDHEQALVSPAIDLSAAAGSVFLRFDYVSFGVGERYRPGIQGRDPMTWPEAPQEVLLQFCSADCDRPSGWGTARGAGGEPVFFPPVDRRSNRLVLGGQTRLDWRNGRIRVPIPPERLVSSFRYRFVPRIGDDAQVGVDAIYIRSDR